MILVSVIGDFYSSVLPLFYEYKEQINTHIILHDDFKNDALHAQKIVNGTLKFIKKEKLAIESYVIKIDEDSISGIQRAIELIDKHVLEYKNLLINITDGLANVGLLLSHEFRPKGAKIITYDRYDNEYNVLTQTLMYTHKIKESIPIKEHLLLKDVDILNVQDISFAKCYEKDINILFEKYEADRALYLYSSDNQAKLNDIGSGFLYEYYIYNLLDKLAFDDILLGVKIQDNRGENLSIINEYDILIMKENHLHMIECKYLKELKATELLYKLDSVRDTLDEDAKIMIVTNFDAYNKTKHLPNQQLPPMLKRAAAKKIYLRGSPIQEKRRFITEVDTIFSLHTANLAEINAKQTTHDSLKAPKRAAMRQEIQEGLTKRLQHDVDYFDSKNLLRLLAFKNTKLLSPFTKDAMHSKKISHFIKRLLTMCSDANEYVSIEEIYELYKESIETK